MILNGLINFLENLPPKTFLTVVDRDVISKICKSIVSAILICLICSKAMAENTIELIKINKKRNIEISEVRTDYNEIVAELKMGDNISYGGLSYKLGEYLGGDFRTRIFAISENKAIRISKEKPYFIEFGDASSFLDGYETLKIVGDSVVRVYPEESRPEFLFNIVERLSPQFTLADFLSRNNVIQDQQHEGAMLRARAAAENNYIFKQLENFVRSFAIFANIGDYHSGQVIWDGLRWILVDWNRETTFAKGVNDINEIIWYLEHQSSLDKEYVAKLKQIVKQERSRKAKRCANLFAL